MKYFELKNEYHHQIAHQKLGKKPTNIAGIPLEIWRSKVFEKC